MKLEILKKKRAKKKLLWRTLPLMPINNVSNFNKFFIFESLQFPINFLNEHCLLANNKAIKFKSTLPIYYSDTSDLMLLKYSTFRKSSFTNFFDFQNVDVPICFKNIDSLRRKSLEQPFLKLINYLMHHGNKEKIFSVLSVSLFFLFKEFKKTPLFLRHSCTSNWLKLYFVFNAVFKKSHTSNSMYPSLTFKNINENFTRSMTTYCYSKNSFKNSLFILLTKSLPLFKYDVYNIDKNVKKFSKKKNSKYIFIWKYIPVYKRKIVLLKMLAKNVKFHIEKNFQKQLSGSLHEYCYHYNDSLVGKLTLFTHNYVFKNFKKSLFTTYKSIV